MPFTLTVKTIDKARQNSFRTLEKVAKSSQPAPPASRRKCTRWRPSPTGPLSNSMSESTPLHTCVWISLKMPGGSKLLSCRLPRSTAPLDRDPEGHPESPLALVVGCHRDCTRVRQEPPEPCSQGEGARELLPFRTRLQGNALGVQAERRYDLQTCGVHRC